LLYINNYADKPVHFIFGIITYYLVSLVSSVEFLIVNCLFLLSAGLIDIDHLFSKPIYHPKRNPFNAHYFHKNWKVVLIAGGLCLFFYPLSFFGIGLISHIALDYAYTKYWLKL